MRKKTNLCRFSHWGLHNIILHDVASLQRFSLLHRVTELRFEYQESYECYDEFNSS